MWATASPRSERWLFPAWVAFAAVGTGLMYALPGLETIPFHLVWISMAVVYGLDPWPERRMLLVLTLVSVGTGGALALHAASGVIGIQELTEVPLMSTLFLVMLWHVHRRTLATAEVSRLAAREHRNHELQQHYVRLVSHEMRTPLTVARGYTELIRADFDEPRLQQETTIVLEELDKLDRMTGRLVTLTLAYERTPTQADPVDLGRLLERTVSRWRPVAHRCWGIEDSGDVVVVGDEARLESALDALVENAVRHTAEGGHVTLRAFSAPRRGFLEVEDDGPGIAQDIRAQVLAGVPVTASSADGGGTGLGLSIVRGVVESHNGTLSILSASGGGALFRISLPREQSWAATTPTAKAAQA